MSNLINFYKGDSFTSYIKDSIYFETSTKSIKVGVSEDTAEVFCVGVKEASLENGILKIKNELGEELTLSIFDILSNSTFDTLNTTNKTIIGAINEISNNRIVTYGNLVFEYDELTNSLNISGESTGAVYDEETETLNILC